MILAGWVPQVVEIAKLNDPKYDIAKMYRDKMSPDFDIIKVDKN